MLAQAALELGELAAEVLDRGAQRAWRPAGVVARLGALAQRVDHLAHARGPLLEPVALELVTERPRGRHSARGGGAGGRAANR